MNPPQHEIPQWKRGGLYGKRAGESTRTEMGIARFLLNSAQEFISHESTQKKASALFFISCISSPSFFLPPQSLRREGEGGAEVRIARLKRRKTAFFPLPRLVISTLIARPLEFNFLFTVCSERRKEGPASRKGESRGVEGRAIPECPFCTFLGPQRRSSCPLSKERGLVFSLILHGKQ